MTEIFPTDPCLVRQEKETSRFLLRARNARALFVNETIRSKNTTKPRNSAVLARRGPRANAMEVLGPRNCAATPPSRDHVGPGTAPYER